MNEYTLRRIWETLIEIIFYDFKPYRKWRMMGDKPAWFLITDKEIKVHLYNGETLINDLDMHPWLRDADPQKRNNYELLTFSIWFPDLDDGLDIEGMRRQIPSDKNYLRKEGKP